MTTTPETPGTPVAPPGARFDPVTGAELGAGGSERREAFALQPGEPVNSFNLVTSLMPLASGTAPQTYRWAIGLGVLIPVIAGALGFLAFAFVAAAVVVPAGTDESLMPSLLTLSDVYLTGYHAAVRGGVTAGTTVTVIGDGAVGLLAVASAKLLGAERIILMGRHEARTDLGREFGATDVVAERGEEGVAKVRELTGGEGAHVVLEAVGARPAYDQAYGVVRAGTDGWGDPVSTTALVVAAALMTVFVAVERAVAEPTLPLGLLRHRVRLGAYAVAGLLFAFIVLQRLVFARRSP